MDCVSHAGKRMRLHHREHGQSFGRSENRGCLPNGDDPNHFHSSRRYIDAAVSRFLIKERATFVKKLLTPDLR